MKKGVVFTLDAIIALSIFIASIVVFYSFFVEERAFGLTGTQIYAESENFLEVYDSNGIYGPELLSAAYKEHQTGGDAEGKINEFLQNFGNYSANIIISEWNGSEFNEAISVQNINFTEKIVVRRYLVLTINESLTRQRGNIRVTTPSTLSGKNITNHIRISNNDSANWTLSVSVGVYNSTDSNFSSWADTSGIDPLIIVPNGTIISIEHNITVPDAAIIGEYYTKVTVTGDHSETATDPFNVMKFGMVEMEVGS